MSVTGYGVEPGATLKDAAVAVLGAARSGAAAARLLLEAGARVRVLDALDDRDLRASFDGLGVNLVLGRTEASDLDGADLVVASPGVRPTSPWRIVAEATSIPVWSEVELAWRAGIRPVIAITGTNGKTTTTQMTAAALVASGIPAVVAGNIGTPLAALRPGQPVVAEISSFQLESIDAFRVPIAVLLNLAPDHLDWHGSYTAYVAAKQRLFSPLGPEDVVIAHASCVEHAANGRAPVTVFDLGPPADGAAGVVDGWIVTPQGPIVPLASLQVRADPFVLDAIAAAAAACALGAEPAAVGRALAAFRPDPHRLEEIAVIGGIRYINDSKATDPHATDAALASFGFPIVLIAGGQNKGLDLGVLARRAGRVRLVIAIGDAAAEVEAAFRPAGVPVERIDDLSDAVKATRTLGRSGDVVLFSPACASFDRFRSYEHRGEVFRAAVHALKEAR